MYMLYFLLLFTHFNCLIFFFLHFYVSYKYPFIVLIFWTSIQGVHGKDALHEDPNP